MIKDTRRRLPWLLPCGDARAGKSPGVEDRLKLLFYPCGEVARIRFVGNDMRRQEHDQLGPAGRVRMAAEQRPDARDVVQDRDALLLAVVVLLDQAAEEDRLAGLDADRAVEPAL